MRLNQDCVRDSLLYFENYLTNINSFVFSHKHYADYQYLKGYSNSDFLYTCLKLKEAGFINCEKVNYVGTQIPKLTISSITWEGHKFLDNIRDDTIWTKTKNILNPLKSISIDLISETASKVIIHYIDKKLGNL